MSIQLTDHEIISEALKTVSVYANQHPGSSFCVEKCAELTVAAIEDIWRKKMFIYRHADLKPSQQAEVDELRARIKPELRAKAFAKATSILKSRTIRQINVATAESILSAELNQRGLPPLFIWQKYRVKVIIPISPGSRMTFIVKYKDIPSRVNEILDTVTAIKELINSSGLMVTIR